MLAVFLLVIILVVLIFMGLWMIWSRHLLWWFLEFSEQHYYSGRVGGDVGLIQRPCVVVCSQTSILLAVLLRRATHRAVYVVQDQRVYSRWFKQLLWRNRVHLISRGQVISRQGKGVILLKQEDFTKYLMQTKETAVLAYVCGANHVRHADGRKTRQQLYIRLKKFSLERTPELITQEMQHLGVHTWDEYVDLLPPLTELWLSHAKLGGARLSVADSTGVALSYHRFLVAVMSLQEQLGPMLEGQDRIGVCCKHLQHLRCDGGVAAGVALVRADLETRGCALALDGDEVAFAP